MSLAPNPQAGQGNPLDSSIGRHSSRYRDSNTTAPFSVIQGKGPERPVKDPFARCNESYITAFRKLGLKPADRELHERLWLRVYSRPGGVAEVHLKDVAEESGYSVRWLKMAINRLFDAGLLEAVHRYNATTFKVRVWHPANPCPPVETDGNLDLKIQKRIFRSKKEGSNPHSFVASFKEKRDLQTGDELESDSEPTTHPVGRAIDGEGRVESELEGVGEVLPYLPRGQAEQAEFEVMDGFEAQGTEAATGPCEPIGGDAVLSTGKPRPEKRAGLQNKTNSGEDSNSAAAAFFAELERFLGRCLKAPHRKYIRQLGEARWRDVRLVAEQIVQGRGSISDPDRYFTAALKKLLDGTWNLVTLSRVNRDDRLSSEQVAWLEVAEARGLLVKGYREGPAYFCELRPGLPGCSEPKLLHQCMNWWPLAWLSQKSGQLTSAELKSILNSARISRGLDPV